MADTPISKNILFQSEQHPLVPLEFDSREGYLLSLIHQKAYARAAEMTDGLDVLDVGCNNGYGTMKIAERSASVIGVDVSSQAIEAAIATHARPNIEYRLVDGAGLPFGDKTFDLVTSFQVIEHVDVVEPYLREIRRVLRDTGQVVFTTPNRCIRLDPGMTPWNPFHVREYEAAELEETLRSVIPNVSVEGLFAVPELYKIEYERVHRAKMAARRPRAAHFRGTARAALFGAAKAVLPKGFVSFLRKAAAGNPANRPVDDAESAELSEFIARWSLSDLFYSDENLDVALDLIAICSMER
ncbi:MAG: class I SAM-dependent methyltransferase [Alphaproteobacteria bacterium]|nr:class I SAM-dependent methyltransferase [Alphaproteobacteria bacterium]